MKEKMKERKKERKKGQGKKIRWKDDRRKGQIFSSQREGPVEAGNHKINFLTISDNRSTL